MKALALLLAFWAGIAAAGDRRYVSDEEAALWSGVGLIYRQGGGSCTGVLIRPDVVLTAAHCVADADAKTIYPARDFAFSAGLRDGSAVETARARKVEVHPGYFIAAPRYDKRRVRADIARVVLERPIAGAPSYALGRTPPSGSALTLLSYPGSARRRASIQEGCRIRTRETEFLTLDCRSEPGASGGPYFAAGPDGRPVVVGMHSGSRERGADTFALALAFEHVRSFIGPSRATAPGAGDASASVRRATTSTGDGTRLPGGSKAGEGLKRFRQ
ncbi:MAG: trypsin-like peptidase domain-containing protein [Pseudomonadota bacterium]